MEEIMADNRMTDFRKRQAKEDAVNHQQQQAQINKLFELIVTLSGRYMGFEQRSSQLIGKTALIANRGEFRSLALLELLAEANLISKNAVVDRAEKLLIETFDRESAEEDELKGLVPTEESTAADGHFATFGIKFFYKGNELVNESLPRGKVEIGKVELFPELDLQLTGMKVGETKKFPLSLQGQTDFAELTLMSLKCRKTPQPPQDQPLAP
jgi:hypothetical protein